MEALPLKETVNGVSPESDIGMVVIAATGAAATLTGILFWLVVPLVLVTVSMALNVPAVLYV